MLAGRTAANGSGIDSKRQSLHAAGIEDPLHRRNETKIAGTDRTVHEVLKALLHSPDVGHMVEALLGEPE